MKTFQDLEKTNESARGIFCREAIEEFKSSQAYQVAKIGQAYYDKHNLTIEAFQKTLRTLSGSVRPDTLSANYKLKTLFFRRLCLQQINYVLGNGLKLADTKNKEKLGKDFDFMLESCAKKAMASGVAFGFWNFDHMEVFGFADSKTEAGFCPLYNEKTAKLDAGIRFWFKEVNDKTILRCTLYEADGFTEYVSNDDKMEILENKRGYIQTKKMLADGTLEEVTDENYGALPIIPMYANDTHESELVGIRECIDCYDFIKSGLANNIDDSSEIYWILKNTGGMDDVDLAQFLYRLKSVHGAVVDGDQGVDVSANTVTIPVEARKTMLEILRKDIYEDFQALDVNTLSAAAKTTQEIQASYQAQDNKCADFEYYILDFVQKILILAGIDDEPSFTWNRVVNQLEQTQMILQSANYLTDEAIIKHLPFLTPEEQDDIIQQRISDDVSRFDDETEEDEEEANEDENMAENGTEEEIEASEEE